VRYGWYVLCTIRTTVSAPSTKSPERQPILPADDEIDDPILGPDSITAQRFDDVRLFAASGYALLLQVAHPTVGAGVRDHSTFEQDPWGRLLRTIDYLYLITYAGREAAAVGRRLREVHKTIKGTNPDGTRYHALEPEAYAWVHATLLEGAIRAHLRFVGPLSQDEIERMCDEYMRLGRLLGLRSEQLPADWPTFLSYFDDMVENKLVRHETVDRVLGSLTEPGRPPQLPAAAERVWHLLRIPPARALRVTTVGLLPPVLRERFGVSWNGVNEAEFRGLAAASRAVGPALPRRLRHMGPDYLRWRADEIARGPLGPAADEAAGREVAHAA
jgi:uncharacterized protein (DUF2236 family)